MDSEHVQLMLHKKVFIPPHRRRKPGADLGPPRRDPNIPVYATRGQFWTEGIEVLGSGADSICLICHEPEQLDARYRKCGHVACVCCIVIWSLDSTDCHTCRETLFETIVSTGSDYLRHPPAPLLPLFPFSCPVKGCELRMPDDASLRTHLITSANKLPGHHACETHWNKVYHSRERLCAHLTECHILRCTICGNEFKAESGSGLRRHIEYEHRNVLIPCEVCFETFTTPNKYWAHKVAERAAYQDLREHHKAVARRRAAKRAAAAAQNTDNKENEGEKTTVGKPRASPVYSTVPYRPRRILGERSANDA